MTKFIFTPESDKMQFGNKVYLHTHGGNLNRSITDTGKNELL
jgi:hypothetical protein